MAKHESKDDEHAASAEAPAEGPEADSTNWVMLSIAGGAALLFFLTMPEPGAHEHSDGSGSHEAAHGAAQLQEAEPTVGNEVEDTTQEMADELDEQYAELAEDDGTIEEEEEEEEEAPPEKEEEKEEEKEAAPPPTPKPAVAPPAPRPVAPRPAPKPAPPAAPKPAAPAPPPAPAEQPSGDNPY